MPRKRMVQPDGSGAPPRRVSRAETTCCAAADSHMPCTIGSPSPASAAAFASVWMGLWSPETSAKPVMRRAATIVADRRNLRVASRSSSAAPRPHRSASSPAPRRPRIANRSASVATTVSPSLISTSTARTRPTPVSVTLRSTAVAVRSACCAGIGVDRDRMVEVHQVQQTLDDRSALIGARGPDQREHRRPGRSDQGVRDDDAGLGVPGRWAARRW